MPGANDDLRALIRRAGGALNGASFLIELPDLGGADLLRRDGIAVKSLVSY